jgi:hypothetical protein
VQEISEGRIVHYVMQGGAHRPAMVVAVFHKEFPGNPGDETGVNMNVQLDGSNDAQDPGVTPTETSRGIAWRPSVRFDEGKSPGTWHWPEHKERYP